MKKIHELNNLDSCLNRAHDGEMIFVLLGRDVAAPTTICHWVEKRIEAGKNILSDPQIQEALKCADEMQEYQKMEEKRHSTRRVKENIDAAIKMLYECRVPHTSHCTNNGFTNNCHCGADRNNSRIKKAVEGLEKSRVEICGQ